jgi:hypothetical protein
MPIYVTALVASHDPVGFQYDPLGEGEASTIIRSIHDTAAEAIKHVNSMPLQTHEPRPVVWEWLKEERPVVNEWVLGSSLRRYVDTSADRGRDSHTEHCCVVHGCKYGKANCTVMTGRLVQSFPCEDCDADLDMRLEHLDEILGPFVEWLLRTRGIDVNWAGDEFGPRVGRLPSAIEEYRKYLKGTRDQVPQVIPSREEK